MNYLSDINYCIKIYYLDHIWSMAMIFQCKKVKQVYNDHHQLAFHIANANRVLIVLYDMSQLPFKRYKLIMYAIVDRQNE